MTRGSGCDHTYYKHGSVMGMGYPRGKFRARCANCNRWFELWGSDLKATKSRPAKHREAPWQIELKDWTCRHRYPNRTEPECLDCGETYE